MTLQTAIFFFFKGIVQITNAESWHQLEKRVEKRKYKSHPVFFKSASITVMRAITSFRKEHCNGAMVLTKKL